MLEPSEVSLPGLDCGLCGCRTCEEFQKVLSKRPEQIHRCVHMSSHRLETSSAPAFSAGISSSEPSPLDKSSTGSATIPILNAQTQPSWRDSLGREFDFYLEHFPEDPGPREIILPHNPMITRELEIQPGDILIGRPLGMSCGCPVTHCGVAMHVDLRTGVIVWCVTGPLGPRQKGFKDLGYYIAEGYEGLVSHSRCELKVGMRYFFQPRMCMLQWRHSGLLNYLCRTSDQYQVRLEGLWIG